MACQSSAANIFHFTEIRIYRTHWIPWPETRGGSRSSRTAGLAAMDATASGASGIAGRETVSNCRRANDTAPTASSHGRDGEHTPAVEDACEDVRGRRSRVVLTPGVCASSLVVMCVARPDAHISHPRGDGGNSASLPGESTKDTVKTIRAGKAGRSGETCGPPRVHLL